MLRFAVHGPGIPEASPRSHGMSCRDVPGRVQVGIAGKAAGPAAEDGLALARSSVNRSACAATPRGERWVHSFDAAGGFFVKPALEKTPAGDEDFPVQGGFPGHSSSGRFEGASGRPGHVADVQILDPDHIKTPGEVRAELLAPVSTAIALTGREPGGSKLHPGAAARVTLSPGKFAPEQPESSLAAGTESGNFQQFASGKRRACSHTTVQAHNFTCPWSRDSAWDDREGDVPPSGAVERHAVGLHSFWHRPGPSKPDPASLRDPNRSGTPIQSAHMPGLNCHNPESLVAPGLAPSRPSVCAAEEISHGLRKVPEGLLLNHLATRTQPVMLSASRSQLPALLQVSRRACASWTPPRLLFDGQIPDEPRVRAVISEDHLLGGRGVQPVAAHANTVSRGSDVSVELRERPVMGSAAGLRSA